MVRIKLHIVYRKACVSCFVFIFVEGISKCFSQEWQTNHWIVDLEGTPFSLQFIDKVLQQDVVCGVSRVGIAVRDDDRCLTVGLGSFHVCPSLFRVEDERKYLA